MWVELGGWWAKVSPKGRYGDVKRPPTSALEGALDVYIFQATLLAHFPSNEEEVLCLLPRSVSVEEVIRQRKM